MKTLLCGSVAILVLSVAIVSESSQSRGAWTFEIDPAVRSGRPAVIAKATADTSQPIYACVRSLREDDRNTTIESASFTPSEEVRIEVPSDLESPTPVEIAVSMSPSMTSPTFSWRTVAPRRGQQLIQYRGKKTFPPPDDFDTYWEEAKHELDKVPITPAIERVPDKDTSTGLLHKVTLPALGATKIVCWYYVPRKAYDNDGRIVAHFPAVIIMPGYGAEEPPVDRTSSGVITLSVNPRNHGPSRDYWKAPVEHLLWNIVEPEKFYYRYAFMDCLQAARFLFTRAEVDPKRVAAEGGSQGGLFALALGALEPRIACVVSNVTAFSAFGDGMLLAERGHHTQYGKLLQDYPTSASRIRRSLAYIDGANLATRIRCPVQINMGGVDPVCNYVTGIVVYNSVPRGVPKEYNVLPMCAHAVPPEMRAWNQAWYRRWLKLP